MVAVVTALQAWAVATFVGGLVGWALWSAWRARRPVHMSGSWLDAQATNETKRGWTDGPRWWLPAEWKQQQRRERFARMAESRRTLHTVRRKDGTA